ncbi:DUF2637 domain-containing protein [Corynebacterium suedekumii]|nr:DUF2637 domain-containing protein [Corynebacterium suedekumii]
MALADLAARSGIASGQAWIWPLLVDGLIVVSTIAVVALDGSRGFWYPWALLICGALVSVAANALHAVVAADASVPSMLAATVAAVPPLVLLASTHLTVVLTRSATVPPGSTAQAPGELPAVAEADPAPAPESEAEPVAEAEAELVLGRRERAAQLREAGWSNKAIADELQVHPRPWAVGLPRRSRNRKPQQEWRQHHEHRPARAGTSIRGRAHRGCARTGHAGRPQRSAAGA